MVIAKTLCDSKTDYFIKKMLIIGRKQHVNVWLLKVN